MTFEVNKKELEQATAWVVQHNRGRCAKAGLDWRFGLGSGIGANVIAECRKCKKTKNVTDYGSW